MKWVMQGCNNQVKRLMHEVQIKMGLHNLAQFSS